MRDFQRPASIILSWSAPTSGGAISGYLVQYRVTGTTPWLLAGQISNSQSFTATGLQVATSYDFAITATNNIGTGPISAAVTVTTLASDILPDAPTAVNITNITTNSMTCSWTAPAFAGMGMVFDVQYSVTGQNLWNSAGTDLSATTVNLSNLAPATSYDIHVTASVGGASGPPAIITAQTAQVTGLVTGITWNLAPIGSFAHGVGAIGVNVHVNPAIAPVQFGFSTSPTIPPSSWAAGVYVNSDLWGQYLPTPASAGLWYGWAEGTDGSAPTLYAIPFTVT